MDRRIAPSALSYRGRISQEQQKHAFLSELEESRRRRKSAGHFKALPSKLQQKLQRMGNWPFSDSEMIPTQRPRELHPLPESPIILEKTEEELPQVPSEKKHNVELRRKFRRNVKLAAMIKETVPPPRKGRQALLDLKSQIVSEAVRHILWEWPTVLAFFRMSDGTESVAWPTTTTAKPIPTFPVTVRALPHLLRTIGLNDVTIVRLLEARLPQFLPALCDRDGIVDDWILYDDDKSPFPLDSPLSYEEFKNGMALSESELEEMCAHYQDKIESQKRATERRLAREKELVKNRQWVVQDLEIAFSAWPPRIRSRKQVSTAAMATLRARQQCALEYSMEAGRLGRKAGLAAAAVSYGKKGGHIYLGAPGVRQCLFNCAREGMGFGGLSAKEIVETTYVHCGERIQAAWRGQRLARKFAKAKALWLRLDQDLMRRVLSPWAKMALRSASIRRLCHRKVVVWRRWAKTESIRNVLYRTCFWPFHIWRRDASSRIRARRKAHLLMVLWHSCVKIRIMRAWRRIATKRARDRRRTVRHLRDQMNSLVSRKLSVWHRYAKERRRLRRAWIQRPGGGEMMHRRHLKRRMAVTIAIWRYWVFLRKHCRLLTASSFRQVQADEEALLELSRADGEESDGYAKKRESEVDAFQLKRARLPQLPGPDLVACFSHGSKRSTTLTEEQRQACLSLCEYFERVILPREVRACWMKYWRAGPGALSALQSYAMERRKEHVADLANVLRCQKYHFLSWKRYVAELLQEESSRVKNEKEKQQEKRRRKSQQHQHRRKNSVAKGKERKQRKSFSQSEKVEHYELEKLKREMQAKKCETLLVEARALAIKARVLADNDRKVRERLTIEEQEETQRLQAFLKKKDDQLREAKSNLTDYAKNIQEHAARQFVDTVYKVFHEATQAHDRAILRHSFRSLRLPWAERRSASLLRRQILRWRLHLCARLRRLNRAMPQYRELRIKWGVWQSWRKSKDNHEAWRTPGIRVELHRRRLLCLSASEYASRQEHKGYASFKSCYLRWTWYVQNRIRWRGLAAVATRRRKLCVEATVFAALRSNAAIAPSSKFAAKRESLIRRSDADIGSYRTFFLSSRRRDYIYERQQIHARSTKKIKRIAMNGPSFKKAINAFRDYANARTKLDRHLLLSAFDMRGRVVSEDSVVEVVTPEHALSTLEAEAFKDPTIPSGCRLASISVVVSFKRGCGLLGIGTTIAGDEDSMANPMRGLDSDSDHFVYKWNKAERLITLELLVGPSHIESIRFEVALFGNKERWSNFGGLAETTTRKSQWFGEVCSSNVGLVRLSGPPGTEIVGLMGRATTSRVVSLGLQVRTVVEESIFSYRWTRPLPNRSTFLAGSPESHAVPDDNEEKCVAEFATLLRYRDSDCTDAVTRAEAFARRLWSSRLAGSRSYLRPLQKLTITERLARWLLSSLASPLPSLPDPRTSVYKDELLRAEMQERRADVERRSAERLERRVRARSAAHEKMMMENGDMRTQRAMQTPQWRKAERARILRDERDLAHAASTHALAIFKKVEAQAKQRRSKERTLRIDPRAPRVRKYYTRLLAAARHEVEMNRNDNATKSDDTLQPVALKAAQLNAAIESAIFRRQQSATYPYVF